jgi:glycosyltransferase involved in cell wall biosynthesis
VTVDPASLPRVAIVYQHLARYRSGVFRELDNAASFTLVVAASTTADDHTIEIMDGTELKQFVKLKNRRFGPFLWQSRLIGLIIRERFDAVIFLGDCAYLSTWVAASLCRLVGSRVMYWTHGWRKQERGFRRLVRMTFYRLAHVLLLYDERAKSLGEEHGYRTDRLEVINNSLDTLAIETAYGAGNQDSEDILRQTYVDGCWKPILLAVCRLTKARELPLLIVAASRLEQQGRGVRVVIVGEGPDRPNIARQAELLEVDVTFTGAIYDERRLADIYGISALTVIPSAAGLTVLQSLQHGRPVIVSGDPSLNGPEWHAVVPGLSGEHFMAGNATSLATVCEVWLARVASDEVAIGKACRNVVMEQWNAKTQCHLIERRLRRELAG